MPENVEDRVLSSSSSSPRWSRPGQTRQGEPVGTSQFQRAEILPLSFVETVESSISFGKSPGVLIVEGVHREGVAARLSSLESKIDALAGAIENMQQTFATFIASLGDKELKVKNPIPVTVRSDNGDGFIATFFDAGVSTGGATPQLAISNLQSLIADFFRLHENESPDNLGPLLKQQHTALMEMVCRNSRKSTRGKPPRSSKDAPETKSNPDSLSRQAKEAGTRT